MLRCKLETDLIPFLIAGANPEVRKNLRDAVTANPQNFKTGGQFEKGPSPPPVLRLNQIEAPALVLVGDADLADVIAYAGDIEAALPIAFMEVWQDCGHVVVRIRSGEPLDFNSDYTSRPAMVQAWNRL